jgi:hypothetical protein
VYSFADANYVFLAYFPFIVQFEALSVQKDHFENFFLIIKNLVGTALPMNFPFFERLIGQNS